MTRRAKATAPKATALTGSASPDALATWLADRRWFQRGPDRTVPTVAGSLAVSLAPPTGAEIVVVDVASGGRYQLLRPAASDRHDASDDPTTVAALASFVAAGGEAAGTSGSAVRATWLPGAPRFGTAKPRPLGGEQSNTSLVIGGTHVLKLFRRLQPGVHPEVEVARHLAAVASDLGQALPVARLAGWWELADPDGTVTALGVVQSLVVGALDGWALVLSALAGDPGSILPRLHELGREVATLHTALAVSAPGPVDGLDDLHSFGAQPFRVDLATKVADGAIAQATALDLDPALLTAVTDRARALAAEVGAAAEAGEAGAAIRHHGDLHLGQVVLGDRGWVILDFEGEPSRPLADRRQRHAPLRDVAGMLRSLSYAVASHHRSGGNQLPEGWEPAARAAFLDGYLSRVAPSLVPSSPLVTSSLLDLLELEKVVYEVGYEKAHRPDWVSIPLEHLQAKVGNSSDGEGHA